MLAYMAKHYWLICNFDPFSLMLPRLSQIILVISTNPELESFYLGLSLLILLPVNAISTIFLCSLCMNICFVPGFPLFLMFNVQFPLRWHSGCPVQVSRRSLEAHLCVCEYSSRVCARGCGYTILNTEEAQHNCVSELRAELDMLR